ncbi:MAG: 2-oxoacid:ferredoxin oxidoreductase subunit beta [Candidatus Hydrothermales bacterium]
MSEIVEKVKIKTFKDYEGYKKPFWCPGCGDFSILSSLKKVSADLGIEPSKTVLVSGIGCSGKSYSFFYANGVHTLHGRVLPVATGIKLANPELLVIGLSGDGDSLAIGGNHFLHTARRNVGIKLIIMNNQIYGLTKGQFSPTSNHGFVTVSSPYGSVEFPIDPVLISLSAGASFVARGFSGEPNSLMEILKAAINHKGFAVVDVLSPCVTYNKINTYEWYRENIKFIPDNHDTSDLKSAILLAISGDGKIPIGIFYRKERRTYEELILDSNNPCKVDLYCGRDRVIELIEELSK